MIRKCTDEELEKVTNPFYDNFHKFVTIYIVPETVSFYIASSYGRNTDAKFNDDFFVCSECRPIADSTLYLYHSNIADKAGLKQIRIHDFRHSCASLLNNRANVTLVAKYSGHTKIEETLNTYSHIFSTALDSVVSVFFILKYPNYLNIYYLHH